jgi:hypothetical protein
LGAAQKMRYERLGFGNLGLCDDEQPISAGEPKGDHNVIARSPLTNPSKLGFVNSPIVSSS